MFMPTRWSKQGTTPQLNGTNVKQPNSNVESQWVFPDLTPTEHQIRLLMGAALYVAVKTLYRTHMYTFGGKVYLQSDGGPIGLRFTTGSMGQSLQTDP